LSDVKLLLGPPAKKRTHRVKRFACQHCGEKFTYRSQVSKHISRVHKQGSGDAATSAVKPITSEGEIGYSF